MERERDLGFHEICLTLEGLIMALAEPAYELSTLSVWEIKTTNRNTENQIKLLISDFDYQSSIFFPNLSSISHSHRAGWIFFVFGNGDGTCLIDF
jgi:hypothetical protein